MLKHGNRTLPGVAPPGNLCVNRQRTKQCDENEDYSGDRRYRTCRKQRDARLIAEGRKVVHTGQPDDLPPRMDGDLMGGVVLNRLTTA
jgi:hypothetical protein